MKEVRSNVMKPKIISQFVRLVVIFAVMMALLLIAPVMAADSYPLQTTDPEVADALNYLRNEQALDTDGSIGSFADAAWMAVAIADADELPDAEQVESNVIYRAISQKRVTFDEDHLAFKTHGGLNFYRFRSFKRRVKTIQKMPHPDMIEIACRNIQNRSAVGDGFDGNVIGNPAFGGIGE